MKKQSTDGNVSASIGAIILIIIAILVKTFRYIIGGLLIFIAIFVVVKIVKNKKAKKVVEESVSPINQNNDVHFERDNSSANYRSKRDRSEKGKSLIAFPDDYCILDLETTGYDPTNDRIIEIGILRVRNNAIVDEFHSLVNPEISISAIITKITKITDEMIIDAPKIKEVLPYAREFIANDIIVAHNANFDVNFMYDQSLMHLSKTFTNDFIDTLRISKKIFPELEHHKMTDIAEKLHIEQENAHRSIADCYTLFKCFTEMKKLFSDKNIETASRNKPKKYDVQKEKTDLKKIVTQNTSFDEGHPLYGKHCVFTGTLKTMSRVRAAQIVVDFGGFCDNGVTKKTNFLIIANASAEKSSKQRKAEEIILNGGNIEILSEDDFLKMIEAK